ncbi:MULTISPECIES: DUF2612 domain-containing protein [Acinetobacter calcoaceticus/baumannii complex]|uniref:DUF2612 domain-containing protein n=1 Tax=Acinetobacter baumannii TaxID=470 RepID=A0A5P1AUG9_ACIBA|nr:MULTISPECIES: DUF2612 domain-containing protein [Acinetobacter calcoaceticus/baumannii complex]MDQ9824402.1 DUF2612 domain-containing protein [Acinetobacter sp. 163]CAH1080219.1 putative phage related protein [Acinetobacter phage MD-2021a]ARG37146.1 hypothetical protein B7L46_20245 [Acinetobacter baumannii]AVN30121.1 DUF2612 domain-containing protein [Acinetobacter baumannii]EHF3479202.1 DUF2612 domain-containing protein [Acinetobacter baumannii]
MDDKTIGDYKKLITSQHRSKTKFVAMVEAVNSPLVDCFNFLNNLHKHYDVDSADDPYLETLARWTGTPLIIPGAAQLEYFGFIDQENALTFGETDDPDVGGYFRESGQSGTGGLIPKGQFLRSLIKAKILKNTSTGNIDQTKEIFKLVLNHDKFKVIDNKDMSVTFKFLTRESYSDRILVQLFFPLPAGVSLIIESV